jgi:hypothetical protein
MFLFILVRGSKSYSVCVWMYLFFLYVCLYVCGGGGEKTTFESVLSYYVDPKDQTKIINIIKQCRFLCCDLEGLK